ncbi:MAG: hypothetical protein AAB943_01175 [Patescibacteria group bacterium]
MGIFSGSKEKGELVALFDIGSSSVGGALFYLRRSKIPKIIFSWREPITLEKQFNFDKFLSSTIQAFDNVAGKVCQAGLGAPKKFFCVLSSPWYASQTRAIRLEKNTTFVFTAKMADSLIEREIGLFKDEHFDKYENVGSKVLPIELKNMKTVLNGYNTPNPINQKATELEMTIFFSICGEQFLKKVQAVVAQHFHREDIKFSSFAMVSFAVARDLFAEQENFLLIDIGGEVTDISMVKENILRNSISFPLGLNFITREVANILDCPLHEARSLISLYKDGHASELALKKLEPLISKVKTEWLTQFQNSLANLSHDLSIPATIFVTVDKDLADFFGEIIKTEQFSQYTLAESKFKIAFLGTEELHDSVIFGEDTARDPSLTLESIYINRFLR